MCIYTTLYQVMRSTTQGKIKEGADCYFLPRFFVKSLRDNKMAAAFPPPPNPPDELMPRD